MKIYVASSWRNERQPAIIERLRAEGHNVYDFRKPAEDGAKFERDMQALANADALVLVQPCGASAHLEAGWAVRDGQIVVVLLDGASKPELMYSMFDFLAGDLDEVIRALAWTTA